MRKRFYTTIVAAVTIASLIASTSCSKEVESGEAEVLGRYVCANGFSSPWRDEYKFPKDSGMIYWYTNSKLQFYVPPREYVCSYEEKLKNGNAPAIKKSPKGATYNDV